MVASSGDGDGDGDYSGKFIGIQHLVSIGKPKFGITEIIK